VRSHNPSNALKNSKQQPGMSDTAPSSLPADNGSQQRSTTDGHLGNLPSDFHSTPDGRYVIERILTQAKRDGWATSIAKGSLGPWLQVNIPIWFDKTNQGMLSK